MSHKKILPKLSKKLDRLEDSPKKKERRRAATIERALRKLAR